MQNILIFIWLFLAELVVQCSSESFVITRNLENRGHDRFEIVNDNFACRESSYLDCKLKNGRRKSNMTGCECSCNKEFTTFGLYNRTWTCQNNTKLRRQSGCQAFFEGEDHSSFVRVLTKSTRYRILFPSSSCSIDYSKSRYRECNGTWNDLDTSASKTFQLLPWSEGLPGKKSRRFSMEVSAQVPSIFLGRMVSLYFKCRKSRFSSCLLFKMTGKLRCPVASAVLPTKHLIMLSTEMPTTTDQSTISSSKATSTVLLLSPTDQPASSEKYPSMVVGVTTAFGIVFLISGIVAMVIIIRRRQKKRIPKSPSQHELSAPHSCDIGESSPQRNAEGGLVYDYAIDQRQNIWARHRVTDDGYEIPQDENRIKTMVCNKTYGIEPNCAYEIPEDNWRLMLSEPNSGYEIPVDNNCSKLRQPDVGYEIPDDYKRQAHIEPNPAYGIVVDNNFSKSRQPSGGFERSGAKKQTHGEPNSDYEILVDTNPSNFMKPNGGCSISDDNKRQTHREPDSPYEIPVDNKISKRRDTNDGYEIPQVYKASYVDMSNSGKRNYKAIGGEQARKDNTLYDSDEYVSMVV